MGDNDHPNYGPFYQGETPDERDITPREMPTVPPQDPSYAQQPYPPEQYPYPQQSYPSYSQQPYVTRPLGPEIMLPPTPQEPSYAAWLKKHQTATGCAALIVLCLIIGVCASLGKSVSNSAGTAQATATIVATDTPVPTATDDPNADYQLYLDAIQPDTTTIGDDLTTLGNDCSAGNTDACYAGMQTLSDDVHQAQADLNEYPAPPCLETFDTNYRATLSLLDKAAKTGMAGIDQNDPYLIDQAASYLQQATRDMKKATTALENNTCA